MKDLLAQVALELFHLPLQLLLAGLPLAVEVPFALLHPGIGLRVQSHRTH